MDGEVAPDGYIAFFAVDGAAPTAGGPIIGGKYRLEVSPGPCLVEIRLTKAEQLPTRYNDDSELRFDVELGDNEQNYDLTR